MKKADDGAQMSVFVPPPSLANDAPESVSRPQIWRCMESGEEMVWMLLVTLLPRSLPWRWCKSQMTRLMAAPDPGAVFPAEDAEGTGSEKARVPSWVSGGQSEAVSAAATRVPLSTLMLARLGLTLSPEDESRDEPVELIATSTSATSSSGTVFDGVGRGIKKGSVVRRDID